MQGVHIQNKKVKRCDVTYDVDGETMPMVTSYKYLGCVIDEYLGQRLGEEHCELVFLSIRRRLVT